jgi:two-component system sensor histidine kinase/response regulator
MSVISDTDSFEQANKSASSSSFVVKLLLVEDDKVNQMLSKKMLIKAGFDVDVANDGLEAKSLLQANKYHLVITDIKVPNMDGYELIKHIRSSANLDTLPVIAVSAYASSIEKQKAIDAGMNDYVAKPYGMNELVETINRYIEN